MAGLTLCGWLAKDTEGFKKLLLDLRDFTGSDPSGSITEAISNYDQEIDTTRNNQLFYYSLALSLQSYSAYAQLTLPRANSILKLSVPVFLLGYLTQKIDYETHPTEKHFSWLFFNLGWGAIFGQIMMKNKVFRNKYMDFFAIWGYAMAYISAFIFKT